MKRTEIKRRSLADTLLATLEPDAIEYRELDGNGLYFRVKPDGNKSWLFRYKKADGKWSNFGLGGYPAISGSMARKRAAEINSDSAIGKNPSISKQVRKAEEMLSANNTFEQLVREWLDGKMKNWVEGAATRNKGSLKLHVYPVFGKRPYTNIAYQVDDEDDLLGAHRGLRG